MNLRFENREPERPKYTVNDVCIAQAFLKHGHWYLHCGFDGNDIRAMNLSNEIVYAFDLHEDIEEIRDVVEIVIEGSEPKVELPF